MTYQKEVLKIYETKKASFSIDGNDRVTERQENEILIPFPEYLERIDKEYKPNTKEHILPHLYDEIPCRDDFQNISYKTEYNPRMLDTNIQNFMVIPKEANAPVRVVITDFKTKNKYPPINKELPIPLSNEIRTYVKDKNIPLNGPVFGVSPLSAFMSKLNDSVDVKGSINILRIGRLRRMKASTPNLTPYERAQLADIMRHSLKTSQTTYKSKQVQVQGKQVQGKPKAKTQQKQGQNQGKKGRKK